MTNPSHRYISAVVRNLAICCGDHPCPSVQRISTACLGYVAIVAHARARRASFDQRVYGVGNVPRVQLIAVGFVCKTVWHETGYRSVSVTTKNHATDTLSLPIAAPTGV